VDKTGEIVVVNSQKYVVTNFTYGGFDDSGKLEVTKMELVKLKDQT
jgi:hypothetical protein